MKYLMSIDAGTGSIRAVVFNRSGEELGLAQIEWTHHKESGVANSMNFDYENNWTLVQKCIIDSCIDAKIEPNQIDAITSSSMREGIVLYDKNYKEIWAVANVDARASTEVEELNEKYKTLEKENYLKSGQTFALGALPRLLWLKKHHRDIYDRVEHLSMISDWILFKLSGIIVSEPSNAGTTGVFNLSTRDWDISMAQKVDIKDTIFPKIIDSGSIIGEVTQAIVEQLQLQPSCKIVIGGGDVQLGTLGLGLLNIGDTAILGGSFWQQIVNIDTKVTPPLNMDIRVNPHVISTLSQAEGITFFSGLVMRWFRDVFAPDKSYGELENMAKDIPAGSYGILPIFSDSMKYGKWYHASPSFLNLSIDPNICNISSMFRSLQENACIVSAINLDKIEEFTQVKSKKIIFAAGASRGELWCQILADVTGKTVVVPEIEEATSLGGAIFCALALDIYNDKEEAIKNMVKFKKEYIPNSSNFDLYKDVRERFEKAYKVQLQLVDDGVTTSMWKAPGL